MGVHEVVLATTTNVEDDLIVAIARRIGVRVLRGSSDDVLSRYLLAAHATRADAVVRCTSDCPLLDPDISSDAVSAFVASQSTSAPLTTPPTTSNGDCHVGSTRKSSLRVLSSKQRPK